ncbi:putative ribonuclease H-like domain-containing protein [Tanacetum coccineum]
MDLENTQNNSLAKLPLLKQGEYDTWRLRIESYIQLQDYTLWEIIEEGNSFKPVARTTANEDARSILMMTLPSEHLLTFNKHKDVKSLFEAIEARFGGNEATKKTQKTLLKQMYETFNASSSKNKSDLGSISFDDFYNNFKIVEPEVKRSVTSSPNSASQNLAFVLGHSSTNDVNTANVHVSTGSTSVSTASTNNSTACLSDVTVYAYLATQPNGSQVVHEDLEQIHEDDLDEMDLKWQLALLSMKARKFYQRTGKKIIINGSDTAGYDKKKVECFNYHKLGHFARECRNLRSQKNGNRSQDSSRRTVNVKESSSKAMLAIDGTGFDWSYLADEEASTNFALMAFSDSEVQNNKTCFKTCLKNYEDLKSKYDKLRIEINKSESDLDSYKKGLALVEKQLVFYKKNESMLCDQIVVLKRDTSFNELDINGLKKQGIGYNVVPPPLTGLFAPPSIDLSNSRLEKFKQPKFEGYGVKVNKDVSENVSKEVKKNSDAPIIEDWVSDCDEDETMVQKPILNNVKMGTGQREVIPVWTNSMRVNHQKISNSRRNFAPTAVLTKSGLVPFSTARENFSRTAAPVSAARPFNTAVHKPFVNIAKPRTNAFQKSHSSLRRPFCQQTTFKNRNLSNKVNTVKANSVNTAKGKRMTSAVGKQGINVVKPTAYWAWRPKIKMINHVYKNTGSCIWEDGKGDIFTTVPRKLVLLDLWGDLRMLFDPNEEDDIWLNQQYWELLKWKLHEYSSVHSLFLDGTSIQINMLVEKKYPLKKEILEKMINLKIEAEEESAMAHELIKFIKSHIAEQS